MIRSHPIPRGMAFAALARAVLLTAPVALVAATAAPAAMAAQQAVSTPAPLQSGVDGPFRPRQPIAAPASATTGADLARQARSRLAASLATNAALSDGRSITRRRRPGPTACRSSHATSTRSTRRTAGA